MLEYLSSKEAGAFAANNLHLIKLQVTQHKYIVCNIQQDNNNWQL